MYVDLAKVLSSFTCICFLLIKALSIVQTNLILIGSFLLNNFPYEFLASTLNNMDFVCRMKIACSSERPWFFLSYSQSDWVRFLHSSMFYYAYNSWIMEMMKLFKTFHFQLSLLIFHPSQPLINFCNIGMRRIQLEADCVPHEWQLGIGQLLTESKLFHNNFTPFWSGFSSASGKFLVTKSFT